MPEKRLAPPPLSVKLEPEPRTGPPSLAGPWPAKDKGILVGVSGGADSVALLLALCRIKPGWPLAVGHVDHGLRAESAQDAEFVRQLAESLRLPFFLRKVSIDARGLSWEDAARNIRRQALNDMLQEAGAQILALGHNLEDQSETVLMRLLAGTGPTGLAGMRVWNGVVWRPLLKTSGQDLRAFLHGLPQPWREDHTNQDTAYRRNHIRLEILPLIRRHLNPHVDKALLRLSEICGQEEDFWSQWCARQNLVSRQGQSIVLDRAAYQKLAPAARRRMLRYALSQWPGYALPPAYERIADLDSLALGPKGRELNLPQGLKAQAEEKIIRLFSANYHEEISGFCFTLREPARLELPQGRRLDMQWSQGPPDFSPQSFTAWLPARSLQWPLTVRPRNQGDRWRALGAPGTKRLSRWLIDQKLPFWLKERTVILADAESILWAGPWRMAQRAGHSPQDDLWLKVTLYDPALIT